MEIQNGEQFDSIAMNYSMQVFAYCTQETVNTDLKETNVWNKYRVTKKFVKKTLKFYIQVPYYLKLVLFMEHGQ